MFSDGIRPNHMAYARIISIEHKSFLDFLLKRSWGTPLHLDGDQPLIPSDYLRAMDFAWAPTWTDRLWSIKPGKNNCLPQALRFASQGLKGTAGSVEARYSGSDVEPQWYVWHIWSSGNEPKPLKKINQEYVPHVWSYAASVQCETDLASIGETWSNQSHFLGLRGPKTDCFTVITSILLPNCGTAIFHHIFLRTCTAKLRTLYGLPFPRVRNASILSRIWVRSAFWHWIEEILQLPEKLLIIQNPFDWSSFFQALVPTCAKSIQILPKDRSGVTGAGLGWPP